MSGPGSGMSSVNTVPPQQNFLVAKQQIGSVRNGQVSYPKDQACFDRWDGENVPESKTQTIVRAIKSEVDKDLLGTRKPKWDTSVGTVGHYKEEQQSKTLFELKKGLKDERIQEPKVKKVYAGCD